MRNKFTVALGLTLFTAACTGIDSPDLVNPQGANLSNTPASKAGVRYTPAEIHSNNPHDWVGQAHNLLVQEMIRELRKPDVKVSGLCDRMKKVVQDKAVLNRLDRRFRETNANILVSAVAYSPLCTSRFRSSKKFRLTSRVIDVSPAAEAAIDDAVAQLEVASSPTELASLLSPILQASYSMSGYDAEAVQATVSVSQSSMELWYDGSEYDAIEDEVFTELDQCLTGNYEEGTYEVDDITYICENSEWRQAAARGYRQEPLFRRVALFTPTPNAAVCGPPSWSIWMMDGVGIAAGAKYGFSTYGLGGALIGAGVGAATMSGGWALYRALYRYNAC